MTKFIMFLSVLFCVFFAHVPTSLGDSVGDGEGYHILPWCPAQGPVYLELEAAGVRGFVGMDVMNLGEDNGHLLGTFKGEQVNLTVHNGKVKGNIGSYPVNWTLDRKSHVIYGLQGCTLVIE
jgi:hypothetical protein